MLNKASRSLLLQCFYAKMQSKPISITRQIQFSFFNSGKYNINKDYYAILGLDKDADQSQIKKEYYKLAKKYHPDVNPLASQKFKLMNEAYQILSDEKLKCEYDQARSNSQMHQIYTSRKQKHQNQYQSPNYQKYSSYQQYQWNKQYPSRTNPYQRMESIFGFDEFGRPVDSYGRLLDIHDRPLVTPAVYRNPASIHDPYNLGGVPKNLYPNTNVYGNQYVAGNPANYQYQARQNPNQM